MANTRCHFVHFRWLARTVPLRTASRPWPSAALPTFFLPQPGGLTARTYLRTRRRLGRDRRWLAGATSGRFSDRTGVLVRRFLFLVYTHNPPTTHRYRYYARVAPACVRAARRAWLPAHKCPPPALWRAPAACLRNAYTPLPCRNFTTHIPYTAFHHYPARHAALPRTATTRAPALFCNARALRCRLALPTLHTRCTALRPTVAADNKAYEPGWTSYSVG